jgi:hypothetical protein
MFIVDLKDASPDGDVFFVTSQQCEGASHMPLGCLLAKGVSIKLSKGNCDPELGEQQQWQQIIFVRGGTQVERHQLLTFGAIEQKQKR